MDGNYTLFADDHGTSYMIDESEPVPTAAELAEIEESALDTFFSLFTRNNPKNGQQLIVNDKESVNNSFWNPERPTSFYVHGWRGNISSGSPSTLIRDAYLSTDDCNVILVDWQKAASNLWYWKVARSVPFVAKHVTKMINFLEKEAGLDTSRLRLVGHSLGGHIVGLAARGADSRVAEVMALDPAKPAFISKGPGERVDITDAVKVQGIHTSSIGLGKAIGDSDFYPNGGILQPGCSIIIPACAHERAWQYYAESIKNPTGFRAGNVFMGGPKFDSK
ncbi:Lipase member H-A [Camponotus floridanus]|uniref:phospholipase A1 n=1 Tax=Camponotus floridanus TaxID=104421 RepID=E2ASV0_CAMFO|nr:Lipase member H-A [Camponotus floridanus]